mmetsp:Transcript_54404/g.168805  ORF Transcript_54404/g.168805 Transcript_54404/m.168805 type:complete len:228 (+) Transcript_54404:318-1001(+)
MSSSFMPRPYSFSCPMDKTCACAAVNVCLTSSSLSLHEEIWAPYFDTLSFCCASCVRFARASWRGSLSWHFSCSTSPSARLLSCSRLATSASLSRRIFSDRSPATRRFRHVPVMASARCPTAARAADVCLLSSTSASCSAAFRHSPQAEPASFNAVSAALISWRVLSDAPFKRWIWRRRISLSRYHRQYSAFACCRFSRAFLRAARVPACFCRFSFFRASQAVRCSS